MCCGQSLCHSQTQPQVQSKMFHSDEAIKLNRHKKVLRMKIRELLNAAGGDGKDNVEGPPLRSPLGSHQI